MLVIPKLTAARRTDKIEDHDQIELLPPFHCQGLVRLNILS